MSEDPQSITVSDLTAWSSEVFALAEQIGKRESLTDRAYAAFAKALSMGFELQVDALAKFCDDDAIKDIAEV